MTETRSEIRFLLDVTEARLDRMRSDDTLLVLRIRRRPAVTTEGRAEGDRGACPVLVGRLTPNGPACETTNACIRFLGPLDTSERHRPLGQQGPAPHLPSSRTSTRSTASRRRATASPSAPPSAIRRPSPPSPRTSPPCAGSGACAKRQEADMTDLRQLLATSGPTIAIEIAAVRGSSLREPGAFMLVTADTCAGTIGGGQLEYAGLDRARQMLCHGLPPETMKIPLGPAIGQRCGGHVILALARLTPARAADLRARACRARTGAGRRTALAGLTCPIGGPSGDKGPTVIAALAAAGIVAWLTRPASPAPPGGRRPSPVRPIPERAPR
jgi:hypothetical protein